ncbi:MAG: type II secretion system protein [Phycisphaeraceae bacterium]|nr:type II secretion system protein [Phycisphaeraceae bacterium]
MGSLRRTTARAYTLIEVLVVVTVLGIAAALVIPEMSSAHSLRVQASVRTIVSDITFAQVRCPCDARGEGCSL